jgi:hypothetical protein
MKMIEKANAFDKREGATQRAAAQVIRPQHCHNILLFKTLNSIFTPYTNMQSLGFVSFAGMALEEEGVYAAVPHQNNTDAILTPY